MQVTQFHHHHHYSQLSLWGTLMKFQLKNWYKNKTVQFLLTVKILIYQKLYAAMMHKTLKAKTNFTWFSNSKFHPKLNPNKKKYHPSLTFFTFYARNTWAERLIKQLVRRLLKALHKVILTKTVFAQRSQNLNNTAQFIRQWMSNVLYWDTFE